MSQFATLEIHSRPIRKFWRAILAGFLFVGPWLFLSAEATALTNPPVGTSWSAAVGNDPATNSTTGTWTATLDEINLTTASFTLNFYGTVRFYTSQVCSGSSVPIPWTSLHLSVSLASTSHVVATTRIVDVSPKTVGSFVGCFPLSPPPSSAPWAASVVQYDSYSFSALIGSFPLSSFTSPSTLKAVATSNASPDGAQVPTDWISLPVLLFAPMTSSSSSTVAPTSVAPTISIASTTSTAAISTTTSPVLDPESVITAPTTTVVSTNDPDSQILNDPERRLNATSEAVTKSVLPIIAALSVFVPTAAGVGALASAGLTGSVGPTTLSETSQRNEDVRTSSDTSPSLTSAHDRVDVKQHVYVPSLNKGGGRTTLNLKSASDSQLFRIEVNSLHSLGRVKLMRTGLRRWAELAAAQPWAAIALPAVVFSTGIASSTLFNRSALSPMLALLLLAAGSIYTPVFGMISTLGWIVGRVYGGPLSLQQAGPEFLMLLVGTLFIPMAIRNCIGPRRGRTFGLDLFFEWVVMPVVAVYLYWTWLLAAAKTSKLWDFAFHAPIGHGVAVIQVSAGQSKWGAAVLAAGCVGVAFVTSVINRTPGNEGRMFRYPETLSELVESVPPPVSQSQRRTIAMKLSFCFAMAIVILFRDMEVWSIVPALMLVGSLLVVHLRRSDSSAFSNVKLHPVAAKIVLIVIGIGFGTVSVPRNWAPVATGLVLGFMVFTNLIPTRSLWSGTPQSEKPQVH